MTLNPSRGARALAMGAALLAARPAAAQQKPLTIDAVFDPEKKVDFGGAPAAGLAWISDTHFLWPQGSPVEYQRVEALTGKATPLFDAARVERALVAEGATAELAHQAVGARGIVMSASYGAMLLPIGGDLYSYDL